MAASAPGPVGTTTPTVTITLTTPALVTLNGPWCLTSRFAISVAHHGAFTLTGRLSLGPTVIRSGVIGSGPATSSPVNVASSFPVCGVPGGPGPYTITAVYTDTTTHAQVTATTALSAKTPSRVHITAAPAPTLVGHAYSFSGRMQYLRSRTWLWTGGTRVVLDLLFLPAGSTTWLAGGTVTTDAYGRWTVPRIASVSGTWMVLYPGSATVLAGSHNVALVVN